MLLAFMRLFFACPSGPAVTRYSCNEWRRSRLEFESRGRNPYGTALGLKQNYITVLPMDNKRSRGILDVNKSRIPSATKLGQWRPARRGCESNEAKRANRRCNFGCDIDCLGRNHVSVCNLRADDGFPFASSTVNSRRRAGYSCGPMSGGFHGDRSIRYW